MADASSSLLTARVAKHRRCAQIELWIRIVFVLGMFAIATLGHEAYNISHSVAVYIKTDPDVAVRLPGEDQCMYDYRNAVWIRFSLHVVFVPYILSMFVLILAVMLLFRGYGEGSGFGTFLRIIHPLRNMRARTARQGECTNSLCEARVTATITMLICAGQLLGDAFFSIWVSTISVHIFEPSFIDISDAEALAMTVNRTQSLFDVRQYDSAEYGALAVRGGWASTLHGLQVITTIGCQVAAAGQMFQRGIATACLLIVLLLARGVMATAREIEDKMVRKLRALRRIVLRVRHQAEQLCAEVVVVGVVDEEEGEEEGAFPMSVRDMRPEAVLLRGTICDAVDELIVLEHGCRLKTLGVTTHRWQLMISASLAVDIMFACVSLAGIGTNASVLLAHTRDAHQCNMTQPIQNALTGLIVFGTSFLTAVAIFSVELHHITIPNRAFRRLVSNVHSEAARTMAAVPDWKRRFGSTLPNFLDALGSEECVARHSFVACGVSIDGRFFAKVVAATSAAFVGIGFVLTQLRSVISSA